MECQSRRFSSLQSTEELTQRLNWQPLVQPLCYSGMPAPCPYHCSSSWVRTDEDSFRQGQQGQAVLYTDMWSKSTQDTKRALTYAAAAAVADAAAATKLEVTHSPAAMAAAAAADVAVAVSEA